MGFQYDDYIDLLIKRDERAFNAVYHASKKQVYAIIRSVVKNESITEDLMQDTYIKMIEKIKSYKKNGKFQFWLNSIAHNIAIDYFRKNKQTIEFNQVEHRFKVDSKPENQLLVESLLKTISPLEKEIVLLHVIDQMTFKEISKIVDKPLGTVLWLYNKAIKQMRMEG